MTSDVMVPPTGEVARSRLDDLEVAMLAEPQVECPTTHTFKPGLYIREATLPAGALVLGHAWRDAQWNIMKSGRILVMVGGKATEMRAPRAFKGPPGRKLAYVLEETVWVNVFATDETDVAAIEEIIVDKTSAWLDAMEARALVSEGQACLS